MVSHFVTPRWIKECRFQQENTEKPQRGTCLALGSQMQPPGEWNIVPQPSPWQPHNELNSAPSDACGDEEGTDFPSLDVLRILWRMIQSLSAPALLLGLCHPPHPQPLPGTEPRAAPQAGSQHRTAPGASRAAIFQNSIHTRALFFVSSSSLPSQLFQELPPPRNSCSAPPNPRESPEQGPTSPPCPPRCRCSAPEEEDGGGEAGPACRGMSVPVPVLFRDFTPHTMKPGQGNCRQFGFLGC